MYYFVPLLRPQWIQRSPFIQCPAMYILCQRRFGISVFRATLVETRLCVFIALICVRKLLFSYYSLYYTQLSNDLSLLFFVCPIYGSSSPCHRLLAVALITCIVVRLYAHCGVVSPYPALSRFSLYSVL